MRYAVIMAGGAGTRLWPMSRTGRPKQLLPFINGKSLLSLAAGRLRELIAPTCVYVCTGEAYTQAVLEDLCVLPLQQILGEPVGRDTANAVAFSAAILHKHDPSSSMAILTADHIIEPVDVFQNALRTAFEMVERHPEYLVTFGITPTYPATGYGYVQRGEAMADFPMVHKVVAFREKPKEEVARHYLASGQYAWNSGMFVWKTATILRQMQEHLPAAYEGVMKIAEAWDTARQREVLHAVYPTLPKISIDFAIMEKAPHVATIAMDVQWLDVGSWPSFGDTLAADAKGNRWANATFAALDSSNVLAVSEVPGHLIATINMKDVIIIHTPNATLVCPAADAERIKAMVAEVERTHGKGLI
jgi:mannose-1-phosphate guanylyltransferase